MGTFYEDGQLQGENPSEAEQELGPQSLNGDLAEAAPDVESEAEPEVGEQPAPTADRAQPEPQAEPRGSRSVARTYVVLERVEFEGEEGTFWQELTTVPARNGVNALRRAFKEAITDDEAHALVSVPATQWHPETVQRSVRAVESVRIGS